MGTRWMDQVRVVRDDDVEPGGERWHLDEDGAPLVRLSAAGTTPRLLTHLRQVWDEAMDPRWPVELGEDVQVDYAVAPTMEAGRVVRLTVGPGRVVAAVSGHDMHPATAAALGPVVTDLWAATRVGAA